jgi:predicted enzyme related to lactoylglutathione lyase
MRMPRVVHFEIPSDDPERSVRFYSELFGWEFQKWDGPMDYWMVTTGGENEPGINGGLMPRQEPSQGVVNVVDVPSVDEYVAKAEAAGGTVVLPKTPVPGVGWLAYITDPDGNVTGMMQEDSNAGGGA